MTTSIAASWCLCLAGVAATGASSLHLLWLMPCVAMMSMLAFSAAMERAMRESWARGGTIYSYASGTSLTVSNSIVLGLVLAALWATPRLLPTWLTATALALFAVVTMLTGLTTIARVRRLTSFMDNAFMEKLQQASSATAKDGS